MFTYDQPGQNVDIRGIFRCVTTSFLRPCYEQGLLNVPSRYSDGAQTGNPNGGPSSLDPGPGIPGLANITGTTTLTPLVPGAAPNATRAVSVSILFKPIASGANLAYLNNTSYQPLKGTTTLLQVQHNPSGYAPLGGGIGAGDQLLLTEDSIQVVDLIVVRLLLLWSLPYSYTRRKEQLR
jgi:iron transport multicopper oxidase